MLKTLRTQLIKTMLSWPAPAPLRPLPRFIKSEVCSSLGVAYNDSSRPKEVPPAGDGRSRPGHVIVRATFGCSATRVCWIQRGVWCSCCESHCDGLCYFTGAYRHASWLSSKTFLGSTWSMHLVNRGGLMGLGARRKAT